MKLGDQFKTGEICTADCNCVFVSYVDGGSQPPPTENERVVNVKRGSTFPLVASSGKPAIWKVQRVG